MLSTLKLKFKSDVKSTSLVKKQRLIKPKQSLNKSSESFFTIRNLMGLPSWEDISVVTRNVRVFYTFGLSDNGISSSRQSLYTLVTFVTLTFGFSS